MFMTSYIFKSKAVRALKGNWQTALIVTFIAGLPTTISRLLNTTQIPPFYLESSLEKAFNVFMQIDPGTFWLIGIVSLLSFLIIPVLNVGCNYYFIRRIQGEELGVMGVLARRRIFFRALLLHLYMYLRVLAWGLLFVVPGILAALRYVMAPYFLAENPELTPTEAIEKSKAVMADKKLSFLLLLLSFFGWAIMAYMTEIMLLSFSVIIAQVAFQFIELFMITYLNASVAAFYLAASRKDGISSAKMEADAFLRQIGAKIPSDRSAGETDDTSGDDTEEPADTPSDDSTETQDTPGDDEEDKE